MAAQMHIPLMQFYINGVRYDNQQWPEWYMTGANGDRILVERHVAHIIDRLASVSAELNDARLQLEASGRILAEYNKKVNEDRSEPPLERGPMSDRQVSVTPTSDSDDPNH